MAKINYIEHTGTVHTVDASEGKTLMETAIDNGVPGIDADCGGACACGTCHVIVDESFFEKVGSPDAIEESMLAMTPERTERSRLSCQITVSDDLDGLTVTLPEFQM
jgi:ferredoxin, 2Fe-2S